MSTMVVFGGGAQRLGGDRCPKFSGLQVPGRRPPLTARVASIVNCCDLSTSWRAVHFHSRATSRPVHRQVPVHRRQLRGDACPSTSLGCLRVYSHGKPQFVFFFCGQNFRRDICIGPRTDGPKCTLAASPRYSC